MGKDRVLAHLGGLNLQLAGSVNGGAGNGIAHAHLFRDGFTGDHGGIHGGIAGDDLTIGGNLFARANDEDIAHLQLGDGDARFLAIPQHGGFLRTHGQQRAQRLGRLPLGLNLEPAAEEQEGNDHSHGLKVDMVHLGRAGGPRHAHRHARLAGVAKE